MWSVRSVWGRPCCRDTCPIRGTQTAGGGERRAGPGGQTPAVPGPDSGNHNGHLAFGCALNAKLPRLASAETGRSRLRREFRRFSEREVTTSGPPPPPPPPTPLKHAGGPAHSLGHLSPETPARGRKSRNGAAAALVATRMRCC